MLILGIETSGSVGGVALVENGQLLGERLLTNRGRRHAQMLTAEIATLFQETQRPPSACQGVAISIGPGSFTGLRIGVVCAKTFAYVVGCPVTAVDTLQAIAEESPLEISRVTVIADAQRGDLYVGRYLRQQAGWVRVGDIAIPSATAWCQAVSAADVVAGPGLERWQKELEGRCQILSDLRVPKATTICQIGTRQFQAGETADMWGLEPCYLRRSSAEEQWDIRYSQ
jgi:tRNA threonylcarbamoyladenosine biosynthesis protein TsaB